MNQVVDKLWGYEVWLVNNEKYCAKILRVKPGFQCSLHMHPIKKESFYVQDGVVDLQIGELNDSGLMDLKQLRLNIGDSHTIEPGTFHRFWSDDGAEILEISTTHSDDDVVRLENSSRRP